MYFLPLPTKYSLNHDNFKTTTLKEDLSSIVRTVCLLFKKRPGRPAASMFGSLIIDPFSPFWRLWPPSFVGWMSCSLQAVSAG